MLVVIALGGCATSSSRGSHAYNAGAVRRVPPGITKGNLWIDPTGGSCVRRAKHVRFSAARACASLGRAYAAARCGDIVLIASGDYAADQVIVRDPRKDACSHPVVFEPAPGAHVGIGRIVAGRYGGGGNDGPSSWTLRNVSIRQGISIWAPAHDVTLDRIHGGTVFVDGVRRVLIENSDFGPCWSDHAVSPQHGCIDNFVIASGDSGVTTDGVEVVRSTLHDYTLTQSHFECVFVEGGRNIEFAGDRFSSCELYAIYIQLWTGQPLDHFVVQNSVFFHTRQPDGTPDPAAIAFSTGASGDGPIRDALIRYNSFAPDEGIVNEDGNAIGTDVRIVANIGGNRWFEPCLVGVVYDYNLWNGRRCSPSDRRLDPLPYVDAAAGNFHLIPRLSKRVLVAADAPDLVVARDLAGHPRPREGPRDPGAFEIQG